MCIEIFIDNATAKVNDSNVTLLESYGFRYFSSGTDYKNYVKDEIKVHAQFYVSSGSIVVTIASMVDPIDTNPFYSAYPTVPNFGTHFKVPSNSSSSATKISYNNCTLDMYNGYKAMLESNGFIKTYSSDYEYHSEINEFKKDVVKVRVVIYEQYNGLVEVTLETLSSPFTEKPLDGYDYKYTNCTEAMFHDYTDLLVSCGFKLVYTGDSSSSLPTTQG